MSGRVACCWFIICRLEPALACTGGHLLSPHFSATVRTAIPGIKVSYFLFLVNKILFKLAGYLIASREGLNSDVNVLIHNLVYYVPIDITITILFTGT